MFNSTIRAGSMRGTTASIARSNTMTELREAQPVPVSQWSTSVCNCCTDPATCEDCCLGCCCWPCGAARAKSWADRSNGIFNLFCMNPVFSYTFVRQQYNIEGSPCGTDCFVAWCCPFCTSRRALTEGRLRGFGPNTDIKGLYGANINKWSSSFCSCGPCELCEACLCPCCVTYEIHKHLQPMTDDCCFNMCCNNPYSMYGQVRHTYGIQTKSPCCDDCCTPCCCLPCALIRARKECERNPNPAKLSVRKNKGGEPMK